MRGAAPGLFSASIGRHREISPESRVQRGWRQIGSNFRSLVARPHIPLGRHCRAALYKGDTRKRTIEVRIDGDKVTTWTSSGKTTNFEAIKLPGLEGRRIELRGVLKRSEWLSITEVRVLPPRLLGPSG